MMYTEETINKGLGLALQEPDSVKSIELFLGYLGTKTKSDRVYIFEEQDGKYVKNTFEWCAENVTAQKENLYKVPLADVDVWYASFRNERNIIISDVEAIKEREPVIYRYLKPQNIHSLVVSPLVSGARIIGFYGVDNPSAELLVHVSDMAWIAGHFLVSMLKKRELVDSLKQLSYFDQLTQLQNRHALNELTDNTKILENVGIIYCDVMGLKKVNDEFGHIAGDELLARASECLRKQFRVCDLYRLGGDEFLVVSINIDEDTFYKRIESLRKDMKDNNALMALGCLWCKRTEDLAQSIVATDYLMYQEKQEYYKNRVK